MRWLAVADGTTWAGLVGAVLLVLSLAAGLGERRRRRRKDLDAVGWVPWRDVAALTAFAGLILLAVAGNAWLHG